MVSPDLENLVTAAKRRSNGRLERPEPKVSAPPNSWGISGAAGIDTSQAQCENTGTGQKKGDEHRKTEIYKVSPGTPKMAQIPMKRRLIILGSIVLFIPFGLAVAFPAVKRNVEADNCSNRMHVILYVMCLTWPAEHDGHLPTSFLSMSPNYLPTPKILVCPADRLHYPAANWAAFTTNNCSYQMFNPGAQAGSSDIVALNCPIHGYTGYANDALYDSAGHGIPPDLSVYEYSVILGAILAVVVEAGFSVVFVISLVTAIKARQISKAS